MMILSRVCAEFHDGEGRILFRIRPSAIQTFQEAPDAIRQDPLFDLLVREGSLEAAVASTRAERTEAEKKMNPEKKVETEKKAKPPRTPVGAGGE